MAKYNWAAGTTARTVLIFVQDSSSSTGVGKTGVSVGNTNVQMIRNLTNNTVTIATVSTTNLTALTDAYLLGGIFPVDAVNAPGWYRFDVPNAALSTGAVSAAINLMDNGANNIAPLTLEIQLDVAPVDVKQWTGNSVSIDNIALWTSITQLNVTQWAGTSVTNNNIVMRSTSATLISAANVYAWAGTSVSASNIAIQDFSTRLNVNVQQWSGKSVSTSDLAVFSVSQTVLTAAAGAGVNVTAWAGITVSGSNVAVQDFSTRLNVNVQQWSGKSVSTSDLAVFSVSQTVLTAAAGAGVNVTSWAGVTVSSSNLAIVDFSTRLNANVQQWAGISTSDDMVPLWTSLTQLNVTQWAGVSVTNNNIVLRSTSATLIAAANVYAWAGTSVSASNVAIRNPGTLADVVLTRAMTESYGTVSAQFTPAQAFYQIWAMLHNFSISAASLTVLKLDHATSAMTFSLDSAATPTKLERTT